MKLEGPVRKGLECPAKESMLLPRVMAAQGGERGYVLLLLKREAF